MAYEGLENLLAVAEELPDTETFLSFVLPFWDFKDSKEQIKRAETLLEFQKKVPQTKKIADAKVTKIEKKRTGTLNSQFINICTMSSGVRVYCKLAYNTPGDKTPKNTKISRHHTTLHECSAYFLACLLGDKYAELFMPSILAKHDDRICMLIEESPYSPSHKVSNWSKLVSEDQVERAVFFDALVSNTDRNPGNFLVCKNTGQLKLIDHEMILKGAYHHGWNTLMSRRSSKKLTAKEKKILENLPALKETLLALLGKQGTSVLLSNASRMLQKGQVN